MNARQVREAARIRFRKPLEEFRKHIEKLGMKPETDIFFIPHYPFGWEAYFGAYNRVWIFESYKGLISLKDVQHPYRFDRNGKLILKS